MKKLPMLVAVLLMVGSMTGCVAAPYEPYPQQPVTGYPAYQTYPNYNVYPVAPTYTVAPAVVIGPTLYFGGSYRGYSRWHSPRR